MFRIAKECGCKFYLGSDLHGTRVLYENFIKAYERLLTCFDFMMKMSF